MSKIKEIKKTADLISFWGNLNKPDISIAYLKTGTCYGVFVQNTLVAGYCLTHTPLDEMITIQQIPPTSQKFGKEDPFKYAEFTGYFVKDKNVEFKLKLHMIRKLLFHKAHYFVYSYSTDQVLVERFYQIGNPLRLYSGKPHKDRLILPISINVEVLSKWGVFEICLFQAIKAVSRKLKGLLS